MVQNVTRAMLLLQNKDFLIKELFKEDKRHHQEHTEYCLVSCHASELIQPQGNLGKHDILHIDNRIQFQYCNDYRKTKETYCVCARHTFHYVCVDKDVAVLCGGRLLGCWVRAFSPPQKSGFRTRAPSGK